MITDTKQRTVEQTTVLDKAAYHIDDSAVGHLAQVLSKMYSKPELAVLREYTNNAVDAHIEAGVTEPVQIWFPTVEDPSLHIRDFGGGLSVEDTKRLLTGYGASGDAKRRTNALTGGFGIGAKVGFAVSPAFTYIIYNGGMKRVWSCYQDEDNRGQSALQFEEKSSERPGIEVIVPFTTSQTVALLREAVGAFRFYNPQPMVMRPTGFVLNVAPPTLYQHKLAVGIGSDKDVDIVVELDADNTRETGYTPFTSWMDNESADSSTMVIVLGHSEYLIDMNQLHLTDITPGESRFLSSVRLRCPNGFVAVSPNREDLQYSQRTVSTLSGIIAKLRTAAVHTKLMRPVEPGKTLFDKVRNIHWLEYMGCKDADKLEPISKDEQKWVLNGRASTVSGITRRRSTVPSLAEGFAAVGLDSSCRYLRACKGYVSWKQSEYGVAEDTLRTTGDASTSVFAGFTDSQKQRIVVVAGETTSKWDPTRSSSDSYSDSTAENNLRLLMGYRRRNNLDDETEIRMLVLPKESMLLPDKMAECPYVKSGHVFVVDLAEAKQCMAEGMLMHDVLRHSSAGSYYGRSSYSSSNARTPRVRTKVGVHSCKLFTPVARDKLIEKLKSYGEASSSYWETAKVVELRKQQGKIYYLPVDKFEIRTDQGDTLRTLLCLTSDIAKKVFWSDGVLVGVRVGDVKTIKDEARYVNAWQHIGEVMDKHRSAMENDDILLASVVGSSCADTVSRLFRFIEWVVRQDAIMELDWWSKRKAEFDRWSRAIRNRARRTCTRGGYNRNSNPDEMDPKDISELIVDILAARWFHVCDDVDGRFLLGTRNENWPKKFDMSEWGYSELPTEITETPLSKLVCDMVYAYPWLASLLETNIGKLADDGLITRVIKKPADRYSKRKTLDNLDMALSWTDGSQFTTVLLNYLGSVEPRVR